MPLDPRHVGRTYGPFVYVLGEEKMREFAFAVQGGTPGVFLPPGAPTTAPLPAGTPPGAGAAGGLVAFPTFAAVFNIRPWGAAVVDPALGLDLVKVLHGEQDFELLAPLRPGDVMTTTGRIAAIYEKAGKDFLVVESESRNARGELVVRGTWTTVIRR